MSKFLDVLLVSPLADGLNWCHLEQFRYESTLLGRTITVPAFEITDFTSSPRAIWAYIAPWGRHGPAACLHDHCYWEQDVTRDEADEVLREAMELLAVSESIATKIYLSVRTFGQESWDRNAALKESGYRRTASAAGAPPYVSII